MYQNNNNHSQHTFNHFNNKLTATVHPLVYKVGYIRNYFGFTLRRIESPAEPANGQTGFYLNSINNSFLDRKYKILLKVDVYRSKRRFSEAIRNFSYANFTKYHKYYTLPVIHKNINLTTNTLMNKTLKKERKKIKVINKIIRSHHRPPIFDYVSSVKSTVVSVRRRLIINSFHIITPFDFIANIIGNNSLLGNSFRFYQF